MMAGWSEASQATSSSSSTSTFRARANAPAYFFDFGAGYKRSFAGLHRLLLAPLVVVLFHTAAVDADGGGKETVCEAIADRD